MLNRLRFKALFPALISSGGTKSISGFAPFARNNYIISSYKRAPTTIQWVKLHTVMDSDKPSLAFAIDVVEKLKSTLPSTTAADDDFDELGPSVSECSESRSDLAKKRPEDSPMKMPATSLRAEQNACHPDTHANLGGKNSALKRKTKGGKQKFIAKNNQNNASSRFISIDNIPPNISSLELREAISVYGEIQSSSLSVGEDGLASCHIKFKSLESKTRALAAGWITVKHSQLRIRALLCKLDHISIRISNISSETSEMAIHSVCTSFGHVFGLARAKEGAADVVFGVVDSAVSKSIVKHLNDMVIDDCRWSAKVLQNGKDSPTVNTGESQRRVGSQINSQLESLRNQLNLQRILLEDLENLHNAVLHLEDAPPDM